MWKSLSKAFLIKYRAHGCSSQACLYCGENPSKMIIPICQECESDSNPQYISKSAIDADISEEDFVNMLREEYTNISSSRMKEYVSSFKDESTARKRYYEMEEKKRKMRQALENKDMESVIEIVGEEYKRWCPRDSMCHRL